MRNYKYRWGVLCESSSINSRTNNLSLFNILEQLKITKELLKDKELSAGVGALQVNYELIILWDKENLKGSPTSDVRIEFVDPNGKSTQKIEFKISTPKKRLRSVVTIPTLHFTTEGNYHFKVYLRDDGEGRFHEVAAIPLEVKIEYAMSGSKGLSKK